MSYRENLTFSVRNAKQPFCKITQKAAITVEFQQIERDASLSRRN